MKMLREPAVLEKMGMGKTKFDSDYIKTGRARWIRSGRIKRMPEHEVDQLIQEEIAARDAEPLAKPKPAFPHAAMLRGAHAPRTKEASRAEEDAA
jgi:hypothetical protein